MTDKLITEELKCELTHSDHHAYQSRMLGALDDIDALHMAKDTFLTNWKSRLKILEEHVQLLRRALRDGFEWRTIDCRVIFHDPLMGMKTTVRTDTGEVVKTEPMTDAEKQLALFQPDKTEERTTPTASGSSAENAPEALQAASE